MNKKELRTKTNELKKLANNLKKEKISQVINDTNEAEIVIYLNESDIYDDYSDPNEPMLKDDFFKVLEQKCEFIPYKYPLKIKIINNSGLTFSKDIKEMIYNHYLIMISKKQLELKKNSVIALALLIIGIVLYIIYFFFQFAYPNQLLFNEIFSIAATFCIWETVDYWLIMRSGLRNEFLFLVRLALAKVEMLEDKKN